MRDTFHADLDTLNDQLIEMSRSVAEAMRGASRVLVESDTARASEVIAGDTDINELQYTVDDRVTEIMTQRQAVATDLRFILSSIRIATDLERMGDMARHVAKLAQRLDPDGALTQTRPIFEAMATAAARIADKTTRVLETRDRLDATQLDLDDDEMDALYSRLLGQLSSQWTHGAEAAVDVAMIGRSYERYGDHAVRIGHQVVYLVTGEIHLDRPQ
ncbi:phosphate signaling complex protein PhoU [Stackebrandtia nassauensis]|uniref:Phosphate-specific transport system accessory protein PhoU n=1 Tax=Stackebrandtia nassauensis (strain DSM 44728 / CIP 108903 / NRRL B-16338 / NBRC 102104 / LLR-40K-21) TaxID=446470 RepID=D3Q242_STANL|nr:phosphate signaling complex protein PhoU [Stackebrandtia nassauensis]ADD41909.1 phosphate uptake regulator, PhoU [Stackebrandtia nassauensis DSM 44728]